MYVCACLYAGSQAAQVRVCSGCEQVGACLLDVRSKLGEGLSVRQDGPGRVAQEADIPDGGKAQLHWDVLLKGSISEVRVYVPCTCTIDTDSQTEVASTGLGLN